MASDGKQRAFDPAAEIAQSRSFVIRGGGPLNGSVRVSGAKNAVLKLMVASILAPGRHVLGNVPNITDVSFMRALLGVMGVQSRLDQEGERRDLTLVTPETLVPDTPYEMVARMRASIVVLGPLLARHGHARVALPGGDDFGQRPVDIHLNGLSRMGAEIKLAQGDIVARAGRLHGARLVLEYPSHTATDNLMMAAVLARGSTVIENAAREPEVVDLAGCLVEMGARIEGAGTSHVEIEGVDELRPARHEVMADRVEAATWMAVAGLTQGNVLVEGARAEHMDMLLAKLEKMGIVIDASLDGIRVSAEGRLRSVDVATLPYPGVATDYEPLIVAMLSVADGVGIVTENLFAGRFRYVDELVRMGADIRTEGHHAVVRGVPRLAGAPVVAPDLRAGAALVLAGLVADGETVVSGAHHVDRGYENLEGKLARLGAKVWRQ